MRSIAFVAACLLLVVKPVCAAENLQAALSAAIASTKVPALGVVVLRDGRIDAQAVHGVRRNDGKQAVTVDDVWLIGSTGKVMTVAMVARLVERGTLSWDAPLEKMLPGLVATMHPQYRQVTLLQLLSHRSGLPRDLKDLGSQNKLFFATTALRQQRLAYVAQALQDAPDAAAGTAFGYSNTGFLVAAAVAEKATGTVYEKLIRTLVFTPLGMRQTGFGNTKNGQVRGHQQGKPMTSMRKFDHGAPAMFAPAGFLHMSLGDWARFNLDQLAGSEGRGKLLTPGSYQLMQTAQPGSPAGLDWGIQDSIAGRKGPVLLHAGSDGNWLAYAILFPQQGTGVLAVANASEEMGSETALQALLGTLLPTLSPAR